MEDAVQGIQAAEICPKNPAVLVAVDDPSLAFPVSCKSYRCQVCGRRKVLETAALMAWAVRKADRGRFFTLTLAPEDFQQRRDRVKEWRRQIRKAGYKWEDCWTTERGAETGMIHIHGMQWGAYVPQRVMQELWGAIVDIRAIREQHVHQYVTKDALKVAGYAVKGGTATHDDLIGFLDFNGGRPTHWSRGFLHGLGRDAAVADMRQELADGEPHDWVVRSYDFEKAPAVDWMVEETM